jgi:chorismate-pyruvate lyase
MSINQKINQDLLGIEHNDFFSIFSQAPTFLRALLVADGTVTKLIEAYALEPLQVLLHCQQAELNQATPENLQLNSSDFYLHRKISLVGSLSSVVYLHAESWIDLTLFKDEIYQDFLQAKMGIGEIIQKCELPTYRRILNFFSEEKEQQILLCRTYVIHVNQQPAIQITEKFPISVFRLSSCGE